MLKGMLDSPPQPSKQSVLQSCSLMNPLSEAEREHLVDHAFMASADRGEAIWIAGAPSDTFSIVGAGFLKMTRTTPHGAEVAVELLGLGQCFGLLAALEGRSYPLSAIAVTPCWYLKIQTRSFLDIYNENPRLRDQMLRTLSPRLRKAHDMMARLSTGKVDQRIAAVLLILGESYGRIGKLGGIRLSVPLTRQDIAEMAGTTVETCIRVMSKWQKTGIVTTNSQVITLRDPDALSAALLD